MTVSDAPHGAGAASEQVAYLAVGVRPSGKEREHRSFLVPGEDPRPAADSAPGARRREARPRPLEGHAAFELPEGRQHLVEEPAPRLGGIDRLGERLEVDAPLLQIVRDFDHVAGGAGDPIELPDDQDIAFTDERERGGELGPVAVGA